MNTTAKLECFKLLVDLVFLVLIHFFY